MIDHIAHNAHDLCDVFVRHRAKYCVGVRRITHLSKLRWTGGREKNDHDRTSHTLIMAMCLGCVDGEVVFYVSCSPYFSFALLGERDKIAPFQQPVTTSNILAASMVRW